jgi:hypothetical protein
MYRLERSHQKGAKLENLEWLLRVPKVGSFGAQFGDLPRVPGKEHSYQIERKYPGVEIAVYWRNEKQVAENKLSLLQVISVTSTILF